MSRSKQIAIIAASIGLGATAQIAAAQPYSPAVPFEQVPVQSQVIGCAYIPSHMEPQMVQPAMIHPRATPVSTTQRENQALNALADQADQGSADQALAALQAKNSAQPKDVAAPLPAYRVAVSSPAIGSQKIRGTTPSSSQPVTPATLGAPKDQVVSTPPVATSGSPQPSLVHLPSKTASSVHIEMPLHVNVVKTMAHPEYIVDIRPGESLATALRSFLKKHGWRLEWLDKKNFVPAFNNSYNADSIVNMVKEIKNSHPMFHFSMYTTNKVVVVTPFSAQLQHIQFDAGE